MCLPLPASASPTVAWSCRLLLPRPAVWLGRGTHPLGGKSWRSDVAGEESAGAGLALSYIPAPQEP